jgi:hypothetical protein
MAEPKPNPKPTEEDINDPKQQEQNMDRDGRERYPDEQADKISSAGRK